MGCVGGSSLWTKQNKTPFWPPALSTLFFDSIAVNLPRVAAQQHNPPLIINTILIPLSILRPVLFYLTILPYILVYMDTLYLNCTCWHHLCTCLHHVGLIKRGLKTSIPPEATVPEQKKEKKTNSPHRAAERRGEVQRWQRQDKGAPASHTPCKRGLALAGLHSQIVFWLESLCVRVEGARILQATKGLLIWEHRWVIR